VISRSTQPLSPALDLRRDPDLHQLFLRPPRSVVGRPSTAVERSFLTYPDCESYTVRGPIAPELKT
jgi:hypothetical protein